MTWTSNTSTGLVAALIVVGASACSADVSDAEPGAVASATALHLQSGVSVALAEPTEAVVAWNVTSGPEDYAYVWGRAALSDGKVSLSLTSPPPVEAVNSYGLAVGLVMVVPQSAGIVDGRQREEDEDRFESILAASERHAIIYVDRAQADAASAAGTLSDNRMRWLFEFEQGYSCGLGKEAPPGETFDSYTPAPCDTFQIRPGNGNFDFPDWT